MKWDRAWEQNLFYFLNIIKSAFFPGVIEPTLSSIPNDFAAPIVSHSKACLVVTLIELGVNDFSRNFRGKFMPTTAEAQILLRSAYQPP